MDAIFKALNDPARRAILDALRTQDGQTLSQLEAQFDMTRFGVMKHLGVLEAADLVRPKKVGRFKHHYLNAAPLQEVIDRWIEPLLQKPAARALLDLKADLEARTMSAGPSLTLTSYLRADAAATVAALTDPGVLAATHPLAATVSAEGPRLTFRDADGASVLVLIQTDRTATRLAQTFAPAWDGAGMPPSRIVWVVAPARATCRLTLHHYALPDAQARMADVWARAMAGLKTHLETGVAQKFPEFPTEP